jgi:hypothetical protein
MGNKTQNAVDESPTAAPELTFSLPRTGHPAQIRTACPSRIIASQRLSDSAGGVKR